MDWGQTGALAGVVVVVATAQGALLRALLGGKIDTVAVKVDALQRQVDGLDRDVRSVMERMMGRP